MRFTLETAKQYENFIGGKWVKPAGNEYIDNISPMTGELFTSIPRQREADIELALDAAHKANDLLSRLSGPRGVWRLQAVGHRP